jgi:hypothetical protein
MSLSLRSSPCSCLIKYKKDLNQAYVKFQSRLSGEIREASSHNPNKFWDILKRCTNAKQSNIEVPLTELYEYQ